ncbi:MAG TPA: alanine--tRNA ligase [Candidatus Dojkabacteria bacterium]|nr:alanine--tRNA ligase [Candidatus Dojkabacteria bacterium]HQF36789.1 alanine--tRNA ligase [Candidatus Dojkabacteria bacterium]
MLSSLEIRKIFTSFWTSEPKNHFQIPNTSLVPNVDSTLLFVNSGMFPIAPYLSGQPHPQGRRLCNIQRCIRTNYDEMIEIGDRRHTSVFEMMGNWSLGDYFKKEQIEWVMELYIKYLKFDPERMYISVWGGNEQIPRDDEAIELWKAQFKKYGVVAQYSDDIHAVPEIQGTANKNNRLFPYTAVGKGWWERAHAPNELGGTTSEMFYDLRDIEKIQTEYHINDDSGRFIEFSNNVFMEYRLDNDLRWQKLKNKNIDFGAGFERTVMIAQNVIDIFETDMFQGLIDKISQLSGKQYKTNKKDNEFTSSFRILSDHARASTFILADGVIPSNKEQGYILRRYIRRMVRFANKLGITSPCTSQLAETVINIMKKAYPHLENNPSITNKNNIMEELEKEEFKFQKTLNKGITQIRKIREFSDSIDGKTAFNLYETYGFPIEMTLDEFNLDVDQAVKVISEFNETEKAHREKSKAGADKKFKGGLADTTEEITKLHTLHHLLLATLKKTIDPSIVQKGSNITAERLRLDFNFDRKLTEDEVNKIEEIVNNVIKQNLLVTRHEMPKVEAEKLGAEMEFGQKYPEIVSVYIVSKNKDITDNRFSAEFCGGPHVENTGKIGENGKIFKIFKQENIGNGLRRIKAGLV